MRTERLISRVKSLLARENRANRIAELTSLLVMLQNDLILELQKNAIKNRRVA